MSDQSDPYDLPPLVGGTSRPRPDDRRGALRQMVRTFRAALSTETRNSLSHAAVQRLVPVLDQLRGSIAADRAGSPVVALYAPVDGEVDVTGAAPALRSAGWTVALPVVLDDRRMEFRTWSADTELARGRFRVLEPVDGIVVVPDVVAVPCVAVDEAGNRLGFGKGFYDRALGGDPRPAAVGVVFDEQVVAAVPAEPWDVPLDLLVTPTRVVRPDR